MILRIDRELFQWDKGRYVYIEGEDKDLIDYLQFFNKKSKYSKKELVSQGKVMIPNSLLKDNIPITVLACSEKTGEEQVITRREFKVLTRPRPEGYIEDDDYIYIIYDGGVEV